MSNSSSTRPGAGQVTISDSELASTHSPSPLCQLLQGDLTAAEKAQVLATARHILDSASKEHQFMAVGPKETAEYLRMWIGGVDATVFAVLFLDTNFRLIAREDLFQGATDRIEVHPRLVVRRALLHNAGSVITAEVSPWGSPHIRSVDREMIKQLKTLLAVADARLLDHFVLSRNGVTSLAMTEGL